MKKTLLIILSLIGLGLTFAFADDATVTTWDSADTTTVEATATTWDSTTYDDADGNHDGKVDDFENCLFVEKKTKRECAKYLSWMAFSGVSFGSWVRSHFGSWMMFSGVRMWSWEFFSGDRRHFGSGTMFSGNTMGTWMRQNLGSGMQMFSGARQNIKNDRQEIWSNWAEIGRASCRERV